MLWKLTENRDLFDHERHYSVIYDFIAKKAILRYPSLTVCQPADTLILLFLRFYFFLFPHMASRRRRFRARPKPQPKRPPTNEEIAVSQIRLVAADGQQLGVMSKQEALAKAQELGTDLVIVAEKADPPVARLLDVGKHMYEKRKKQAKQKVKAKSSNIKGVRIGFKTGEHDWQLRLHQAEEFLQEGHKVRLEMRLRGREKGRLDQAEQKMREFVTALAIPARIEGSVGRSPRGLTIMLTR
ncbi:MAG: translation initiation factor IF-3 [Candidatus Andersenbacteria bacterium CG10_big_fil_rev_8_21_14_0_10_54_11]|uniref:Translation initiation factor IF-3 n=1 Tax=Candidatus Andersenbacteria bacterium CG10_big_fil_rev_8_21_14_0_10_54_11 TaxID=1974485 RepID=A0A2M6X0E3_9BACT|nr:MAG: translation initiation factor IF-3 [Candidatus Andersenbacteria bacterium CG10_big_fil_rev_8_21_14_0_10_54_11]